VREGEEGLKAIRKGRKRVKVEDTKEMMHHWISSGLATSF
jgi:hypothetical protein